MAAAASSGDAFSTRIAVALNSAVPDFGSHVSRVGMLVSTGWGNGGLMTAGPSGSVTSTLTGAVIVPRREEILAIASLARPSLAASSGDRFTVSLRRSGVENWLVATPVV